MRLNTLGEVAFNDSGQAVAPWLNDVTVGPYQRDLGGDTWQLVTRAGGVVTPVAGVSGGCNQCAAGGGQWMRRLDAPPKQPPNNTPLPQLYGNQPWSPPNGFTGDIDGNLALTISNDGLTLRVFDNGAAVRDIPRQNPFGGVRLKGTIATWFAFNVTPNIVAWDVVANVPVPVTALPGPQYTPIVFEQAPNVTWVLYQVDALGGVCHRIHDASQGYKFGTAKSVFDPDVILQGQGCVIGWSDDAGQFKPQTMNIPVLGEGMMPLAVPPHPEPDTFGPISAPRPHGYIIEDVADFLISDPALMPRKDTHTVTQHVAGNSVYWGKFYDPDRLNPITGQPEPEWSKHCYEKHVIGDKYIHLAGDGSDASKIVSTSDTRWLPRQCAVGVGHLFKLPPHDLIQRDRATCAILSQHGWARTMGIYQAWEKFDCGRDLGVREVICIVADNTGGIWAHDRGIELFWYARGAGCMRWEYHRSDRAAGETNGVYRFNDYSLSRNPDGSLMRSDFYHLSPHQWVPEISPCVLPISPEVPVSVPMPAPVFATVQRFHLMRPAPRGVPGTVQDDNCRAWCRALAETISFFHGDDWGHKSTSSSSPASKDVIAWRQGSQLHGYDVLTAAGSGAPSLSNPPGWIDITGQFFIDVPAVNHFTGSSTPSGRPVPTKATATTSFDLGEALEKGYGEAWLKMLVAEGVTRPRILLARQPSAMTLAIAFSRIPMLLSRLAFYKMSAELTLLADTKKYGLTEASALQWVKDCIGLIVSQPAGVGCIQGANEPVHDTQQPFVGWESFMAQVAALVPNQFAYTAGPCTHGGGRFGNVSYLTTHGDRSKTAYQNAKVSKQLSLDTGLPVWEDEPIGIDEVAKPGSRTNDPQYGFELADAAANEGLLGSTLHTQAGLTCTLVNFGPIHLDALRRYVKRTGGTPIPPGPVHPILDAPMSPEYPVGYNFWIANRGAIEVEVPAWYTRATGRIPAASDVAHGLWRCINECDRWKTLRAALENTWPGGAPKP